MQTKKPNGCPKTPFSTPLSGSARATELRLRNLFQGGKKRPPIWLMVLAACLCLLCGSLVSCQSAQAEGIDHTSTLSAAPVMGYVEGETLRLCREDEYIAAVLPLDLATSDLPGMPRDQKDWEDWDADTTLDAFYGAGPDFQWAVVCSGTSAGSAMQNVLISLDSGETWTRTGGNVYTQATGALFLTPEHGFLCYRCFSSRGPEIFETLDGGQSWTALEIPVPEVLSNAKLTPCTPYTEMTP